MAHMIATMKQNRSALSSKRRRKRKVVSGHLNRNIENTKEIDLNDEFHFSLTGDTLTVNDFPGESYESQLSGTHYFIRN